MLLLSNIIRVLPCNELLLASNTLCGGENILSEAIKTVTPNLCRPPTRLWWSECTLPTPASLLHTLRRSKRTLPTSAIPLHDLRCSKRTLQNPARLLHTLRWSKRNLRSSETLCREQNGHSEALQAFYMICCGQNELSSAFTWFAHAKTRFPKLLKPPICFVVIKTQTMNSASLLRDLRRTKRSLQFSTSLLHALRY